MRDTVMDTGLVSAASLSLAKPPILAGIPEIPAADMVEVSLRYGNTFVLVDMLPPDLFALLRPYALGAKLVVPFTALIVVDAGPFAAHSTHLSRNIVVGLAGDTVASGGAAAIFSTHWRQSQTGQQHLTEKQLHLT